MLFEAYVQSHASAVSLLETIANIQSRMAALGDRPSYRAFDTDFDTLSQQVAAHQWAAFDKQLSNARTKMYALTHTDSRGLQGSPARSTFISSKLPTESTASNLHPRLGPDYADPELEH